MWDAVVVGNGVMGASALASLAAAGLKVLGIDRYAPPHEHGSSQGETRVTRTAYFEDPRYVPLLRRSFLRYVSLEREVGRRLFQPTLGLHFGPPAHPGMRGVEAAVKEHWVRHTRPTPAEVVARFGMHPSEGDACLVEEEAGVLAAEPMVAAFLEVARRHGAVLLPNTPVIAVEAGSGHAIVDTGQERFEAAHVVLAQGAWGAGADLAPPPCPLSVERQVQLWFSPHDPTAFLADRFPIFIHFDEAGSFYGIPRVEGFGALSARAVKVCEHHGGTQTTAETLDRSVHPEDETRVRAFVQRFLPGLGDIVGRRVCMYTNTPDDHFVIGPHPDVPRMTVALGFSGHGFKLAPVVGEMIRDQVMQNEAPLALFDPRRFRG